LFGRISLQGEFQFIISAGLAVPGHAGEKSKNQQSMRVIREALKEILPG
jgi:hypothetical protein